MPLRSVPMCGPCTQSIAWAKYSIRPVVEKVCVTVLQWQMTLFLSLLVSLKLYQVGASVRCLLWWGETSVLIGCLDGSIYEWKIGEKVEVVCHLEGSVIIMRWNHTRKVSIFVLWLCLCVVCGYVWVPKECFGSGICMYMYVLLYCCRNIDY